MPSGTIDITHIPASPELAASIHQLVVCTSLAMSRPVPTRYFIKWPIALLTGLLCVLFWRVPASDEDIVALVENTSLVTILKRDLAAENTSSSLIEPMPLLETRVYIINVGECRLEHVVRSSPNSAGGQTQGKTEIKSWSMSYSKSRAKGDPKAPWTATIHSFKINEESINEPERRYAFLHHYYTAGIHTKSHVFGEALVDRILSDSTLRETLYESTWTTKALHFGLVNGSLGPLRTIRWASSRDQ